MPLHHGLRSAAGASPSDPYFSSTSLLLLGNGTNGGQNNTFADSSTNNFTITRNGNTTQGSFSPFSAPDGRWSNYFDGSGDYLTGPSNSAFSFGTSDFTAECWVYFTSLPTANQSLFDFRNGSDNSSFFMGVYSNNIPFIANQSGGLLNGSFTFNVNTWYHIAYTRSGTSLNIWVNGTNVGTTTNSTNLTGTNCKIGADSSGAYNFFGYISNARVLKNTAQYTAAFTPPSAPLTAITNTSLLTCQSNRFKDNSSNAFTITPSGNAAVTSFSPFAPLAEYSAGSNGGSGYFDGSGDKLTIPVNQAPLLLGSSDFSFECWIYWTQSISRAIFYIAQNDGATATGSSYMFSVANSSSTSDFWIGSSYYGVTCPIPNLNSWAHIAFSRTGGTLSSFLNGNRIGTRSDLGTGSINNGSTAYPQTIGTNSDGSSAFQGYISGMRLIKGSGGYDATQSTITVPTSPLTAITNTSLLLNFTNASIIDSTAKNDLETVGDAQISTSVKKFGTGSLKFDGTGDWLSIAHQDILNFGSSNFTIECWVYPVSNSAVQSIYYKSESDSTGIILALNNISAGKVNFYSGNGSSWYVAIDSSSTISLNTWTHLAATRNGSTWTVWINGTSSGTATSSTNPSSTTELAKVGRFRTANPLIFDGYIDDLRITKGVARYTANFTPPAAQLPAR